MAEEPKSKCEKNNECEGKKKKKKKEEEVTEEEETQNKTYEK